MWRAGRASVHVVSCDDSTWQLNYVVYAYSMTMRYVYYLQSGLVSSRSARLDLVFCRLQAAMHGGCSQHRSSNFHEL